MHTFIIADQLTGAFITGLNIITLYRVGLYLNDEGKGYLNFNSKRIEPKSIDYIKSHVRLLN